MRGVRSGWVRHMKVETRLNAPKTMNHESHIEVSRVPIMRMSGNCQLQC